jgi:hypothetical protein
MNEKIRELALQSGAKLQFNRTESATNQWSLLGNDNLAQFAESIIKETIKIIQATAAESIDLDRTLVENVSWTVNDIKKHFGVE